MQPPNNRPNKLGHEGDRQMSIQLGQVAPDFEQDSTEGRIRFHDWLGSSWGILFSHPKDYTPVCTTELAEAARLKPEWDKRKVRIIGLSVDSGESHAGWAADIKETQGQSVNFPVLADADRTVSDLYGMVHPEADPSITVRSVFVIDPNKKVRLTQTYPPSTGRNFAEILRVVDSLQLTDAHKVATPVNWKDGDQVIIVPSLSDEDAKLRFPNGWTTLKPYLRMVDQPKLPR
jgi:alkyl hydroperoxide reductase subunit AhpC